MSAADEVALFPLHHVLFPDERLPLRLFEARYLELAAECLRTGRPFGICAIVEGHEVGEPALPASVGTLARIEQWEMHQPGLLHVVARGERRFRIQSRRLEANGLQRARVELLAEERDAPVAATPRPCREVVEALLAAAKLGPAEREAVLASSLALVRTLARLIALPLSERQRLLELDDGPARLEALCALLACVTGKAP